MLPQVIGHLIFCLLLFSTSHAHADLDLALSAYEHGDFITAYQEFSRLAQAGSSIAQYNLGFMYFEGDGVPQDDAKAFHWFEQAARAGYARAQDILAYMYNHGRGIDVDKVRAYVWYGVAASNGIFLAENIKQELANELASPERVQADIMLDYYLKKYTNQ